MICDPGCEEFWMHWSFGAAGGESLLYGHAWACTPCVRQSPALNNKRAPVGLKSTTISTRVCVPCFCVGAFWQPTNQLIINYLPMSLHVRSLPNPHICILPFECPRVLVCSFVCAIILKVRTIPVWLRSSGREFGEKTGFGEMQKPILILLRHFVATTCYQDAGRKCMTENKRRSGSLVYDTTEARLLPASVVRVGLDTQTVVTAT